MVMNMNKHHRRPDQGHPSPPHEMYFDTKAYAAAISQLAKALAELEPQAVFELLEEAEYLLTHDLAETLSREHPDFDAKLEVLRQSDDA